MKLFYLFLIFSIISTVEAQNGFYEKKINTENFVSFEYNFKNAVEAKVGFFWISTEMGLFKYDGNSITKVCDPRFPQIGKNRIVKLGKDYFSGDLFFCTYPENYIYSIRNNQIQRLTSIDTTYKYLFSEYGKCIIPNNANSNFILKYLNRNYSPKDISSANGERFMIKNGENFFIIIDSTLLVFNATKQPKKIVFSNSKNIQLISNQGKVYIIDYKIKNSKVYKYETNEDAKIKLTPIKIDNVIVSFLHSISKKENRQDLRRHFIFDNQNYFLNFNGKMYQLSFKEDQIVTKLFFENPDNDYYNISYSKENAISLYNRFGKGVSIQYRNLFNSFEVNDFEVNMGHCLAILDEKTWILDNGWKFNRNEKELRKYANYTNKGFLMNYKGFWYYCGKNNSLYNVSTGQELHSYKPTENPLRAYTYLKNDLWLCDNKVLKYKIDSHFVVDTFLLKKSLDFEINNISAFNEDLILETTKGVYFYTPFKKITPVKGLEKSYARYFKVIDSNSFWIITYGDGMYLVKNKKAYKVIDKNFDFDTNTAHAIEDDKQGNIWISTNNGIVIINKNRIINNTLMNLPVECYRFSVADGLLTNNYNGISKHASIQTKEGVIGFPSSKGFVWFNPNQIAKHIFKSNIVLDKIVIDNKKNIVINNNQFLIPKEAEVLSINFSYPYFYNRENLTIAYRFENQEKWTSIKGNSFQIGRYKNGAHKLLIRITTHGIDDVNGITQAYVLNFESRYYEIFWIWILLILSILILLYIVYRIGLNANKKRKILLREKIAEKRLELLGNSEELEMSKKQLSKSLKEKEILLKEIHHRVKNNLQIVMSLLSIEAHEGKSKKISDFLEISESRIQSMLLIHQSLYENNRFDSIVFQLYLEQLVANLKGIMGVKVANIEFKIDAKNVFITIDTALPLGLVINELLTNTFKHAFPNQRKGEVEIKIYQISETEFELIYSDNGVGFDANQNVSQSFGMDLIRMLVKQLKGTVYLEPFKGVKYRFPFKQCND